MGTRRNDMKSFLAILIGSELGGITYLSATYNSYPSDPAFYLSYFGYTVFFAVIALVTALIFFGFFCLFSVKSKKLTLLVTAAFVTQILIWMVPMLFSPDWNGLVLAAGGILFPLIANFVLGILDRGTSKSIE